MQICGIVAEYNPFHNGHAYQIREAKKKTGCDCLIVVMSGNWVQRGEPAIVDKWKRSRSAIENGADVVIELPFLYVNQSADQFAHGAVHLLKKANVDSICFGSECGDLEYLKEVADLPIYLNDFKDHLDNGESFPKTFSYFTADLKSNDILAVSYLREMKDTNIQPVVIQRTNDYLSDELNEISSAMAIRKGIENKADITNTTPMAKILEESECVYLKQFYPYIRTYLIMTSKERLHETFLFSEGIENHLKKCAENADTFEIFLSLAVNARYTASRIKRSLVSMLLQFTKKEKEDLGEADYLRILAFNETGRKWLSQMRDQDVCIASKFPQIPKNFREIEYRSTLLYSSALSESERKRILKEEILGSRYVRQV